MVISNATDVQIVNEWISKVTNLLDFDKDTFQKISENIRPPGVRVPDPKYITSVSLPVSLPTLPTIPIPTFIFDEKSRKQLLIVCDLIRFYDII